MAGLPQFLVIQLLLLELMVLQLPLPDLSDAGVDHALLLLLDLTVTVLQFSMLKLMLLFSVEITKNSTPECECVGFCGRHNLVHPCSRLSPRSNWLGKHLLNLTFQIFFHVQYCTVQYLVPAKHNSIINIK
jgi:hypothetical protein